ncbi:MAG: molybdenum cofactor biosynthesis protein MoaE [Candidatus Azosocius agrarius]|nr:MAG: molybdenum cofactor biosynthesis protein MoaE [Gammaproteobacteria bacterium]
MNNYFCEISLDLIDVEKIVKKYFKIEYGAVVFFVGKIRNFNIEKKVMGITYDMCDELVLRILSNVCEHYCKIYKNIKIYISHFKGYIKIGYVSILIIVESYNRKNAFIICNMILEDIKNKTPIWKYEHYFTKNSTWIDGNILT